MFSLAVAGCVGGTGLGNRGYCRYCGYCGMNGNASCSAGGASVLELEGSCGPCGEGATVPMGRRGGGVSAGGSGNTGY